MVDGQEVVSPAGVRVGPVAERCRQWERVEPGGGAFLGEEDVVQVGEQCLEAFAGPILAAFDGTVSCLGLFRGLGPFLGASWFQRNRDSCATSHDLDVASWATGFDHAVDAQATGSFRDGVEDEHVVARRADDVPYDVMDSGHGRDSTRARLEQERIAGEVVSEVDQVVMRLGALLHEAALLTGRERFETWIAEELPFDVRSARRMRAVYLAYRELPAEMLVEMPAPRAALFAKPDIP